MASTSIPNAFDASTPRGLTPLTRSRATVSKAREAPVSKVNQLLPLSTTSP